MKRESCNVAYVDRFAVQLKDGATDTVDAPDTALKGLGLVDDVEARGDACEACRSSKLRIGRIHENIMLVCSQGVESGRITGGGHFVR